MKDNRRDFIKKGSTLAAALSLGTIAGATVSLVNDTVQTQSATKVTWPIAEGANTPKITMSVGNNATVSQMKSIKQFGADYVHMGGPRTLPWTEEALREIIDRFKAEGLTVINMMINFSGAIVQGTQDRDAEIKKVQDSIIAAGKAGLPVIEYNFYSHRAVEGYYDIVGRGGSQYLGYDYYRKGQTNPADNQWNYKKARTTEEENLSMSELKPTEKEPAITKEQAWDSITYFLKAVIPVAVKAGVRMALHPNDPPPPMSRGSEQIMSTFKDWKRMMDIVDSPANGMTFDCGVSAEIGENPVEVARYMMSKDRISHVHYRNVIVEKPRIKYVETFIDNGAVDMLAVMQELVKAKYKYSIWAEHPRDNEFDRTHQSGGFASYLFNMAYARAMLQACIVLDKK
jgi:mannonate dehydratase